MDDLGYRVEGSSVSTQWLKVSRDKRGLRVYM